MSSVKTPADLVSAIPFLVGYHPTNSLVVISVKDDGLEMAMRIDFPNEGAPKAVFETLANHLKTNEAESALAVGYVNSDNTNADEIMHEVRDAISALDIEVRELMVIKNNRYRSLLCVDETCCPPEGNEMPDFESARITAEQVANGKVLPFASNEGLVASLDRYESADDKTFRDLVNSKLENNQVNKGEFTNEFQRAGAEALEQMKLLTAFETEATDELKAQVIAGVQDIQVRDYALGLFNDCEVGKNFYLYLFKSAPKEFSHPLASLASAYAYESGEGALAHRLLDKAVENDPDYSLSRLLRRVFSAGWPPSGFAQLRTELHPRVTATIFGE